MGTAVLRDRRARPVAVSRAVKPAHGHHRLLGAAELWFLAKLCRWPSGCLYVLVVLRVGHLDFSQAKRRYAMNGALFVAAVLLAQGKLTTGAPNDLWDFCEPH